MRNKIIYEWAAEIVDEHGDIIDPIYCDSLEEALEVDIGQFPEAVRKDIALVKYIGNEYDSELAREYFYIKDSTLQPNECGELAPAKYRAKVDKIFRPGNSILLAPC